MGSLPGLGEGPGDSTTTMSVALEELRREMGRMKTHIVSQGEELLRLKRATGEDGSHLGSKRLTDIECELGEQKKSTEKITKLCLAAIKALEKLEKAPIEFSSLEQCNQASQESIERGNSVDPVIVKTMCEQLDVINKLLIKVDDDIEAVDEKAESSLADYEQLNLRMTEIDKRIKESKDSTMGEVRALLVSRTYATREDLSRAIATAQASKQVGLNKEEVASMIEKATSNFLRTVHADTASCTERTQDCEELVKAERSKLGAKLNETDKFARTEARQIQDTTDKNMKEVTRTLASLVEQHRTKTSSENAEAFERLNRRLDNEVKNFSDMVKEVKDLGLKEAEESKLLTRLERLAKDVTALKADQVKLGQAMEQCVSHQSSLDIQTKNMTKIVEQQKEEVSKLGKKQEEGAKIDKLGKLENTVVDLGQKVEGINGKLSKNKEETGKMEKLGKLETTVGDLGQKIESIGRLGDTLVLECSKKVDKTELDEIKNGMEKERCKINYFQDKILNIAKVAETAKADTGSLKDKLTTEMAQTTNKMQTITGQVDKHSEDIKEHCEALKGITRDSIGKIKDVATNCAQIEANIRNIRDKSVVFDNELRSIKEQLAHTTYKLEENKEQEAAKDVKMVIKEKEEEVKKLGESLDAVKKKVQLNSMELSNIKEDKRTKEGETEERQQSLEQNLLDVRTYVERMLQETNKQLAGITGEVESTDRKIKRCSADILDIINRQERATGDSSTALAALETQVRELQEQEVMRRVELAGEMLELRGGANDKQAEVLEKVQTAVDGVAGLRRETQGNMDKLESQVSLLHDAGAERERKAGIAMASLKDTLESKVTGLETKVTGVLKEVEAVKKESKTGTETCAESMGKIQLKLAGFMQADETRAMQVKTVKEALERVEKEAGTWKKEDSNKKEKLKEELEGVLKNIDAVKSHVDTRVENMRKNMIDMIGNNEMKTGEIEQKLKETDITVKNMGIVQNNQQPILESKLMTVKDEIEKTVIDKLKVKNPSTIELENATAALRKDIDQVKTEIKDNDLEGFKNIVNNTNETQNKLITSIQKNIDEMNREKCEMEGQMTIMDERITQVSILREAGEKELKVNIKKEQESGERLGEKVQTLALGLREIQASTAAMANIDSVEQVKTSLSSLKDDVSETKLDLGRRVSRSIKEKSDLAENKL